MKAFVAGVIAMTVISVAAWAVLTHVVDRSSASVYTSKQPGAVRLSSGEGDHDDE